MMTQTTPKGRHGTLLAAARGALPLGLVFLILVLSMNGAPSPWLFAAFLLLSSLLPALWPAWSGSWQVVATLLALAFLPSLWARMDGLLLNNHPIVFAVVAYAAVAIWLALPLSLAILMWRRQASPAVMLAGLVVAPAAAALLMVSGGPDATALIRTPADLLRMLGVALPMWFVMLSCTLGPAFFAVAFVWLFFREALAAD